MRWRGMGNKIFLIFLFSIVLIFPVFTNAKEECIFDSLIKVDGSGICFRNCSIIYSKELNDIYITPLKSNVRIWFYPIEDSNNEPPSAPRTSQRLPLHLLQPTPKFRYYYWISADGDNIQQALGVRVLSYEYFNLCINQELNLSTNQPKLPKNNDTINVNIINNKGPVTIGNIGSHSNQNTQNIPQSRNIVDYIKDYIIQILAGITVLIIGKKLLINILKRKKSKRKIKK